MKKHWFWVIYDYDIRVSSGHGAVGMWTEKKRRRRRWRRRRLSKWEVLFHSPFLATNSCVLYFIDCNTSYLIWQEIIQQAQQQRRGKTIHYESFALHYINLSIDTKLKHKPEWQSEGKGKEEKAGAKGLIFSNPSVVCQQEKEKKI